MLAVLGAMRQLVDLEARSRVRRASLVPINIACAALTEWGRSEATSAILTALHKMPRKWQLENEQDEDRANHRVDLCTTMELEALEEQADEQADVDLALELLTTPLDREASDDARKTSNMQLAPVPPALEHQLEQYRAYRQQPFHRLRASGGAVEASTVESDRANALRWLGFVKAEHGGAPSLRLFAHARVGEWTEAWVLKLRALGCKSSTVSSYVNGVISVSTYALTLVEEPEACPTDELLTLRKQAESIAKQERLFEPKSPHWLPWLDAQRARQACVAKYNAATGKEAKRSLLRDCLILAFHTLQPPDRVGGARARPP